MYKCYQNPVQYNQLKKSKMESICMNIFSLTWIKSKQCNNTCSNENISLHKIQHWWGGGGGERGIFLLSTGNSESEMNGQYVAVIESFLLLGQNGRMSRSRLFWIDLVQFVQGIVVPLILPEPSDVTVPAWFQIRERDVFV